MKYLLMIIVCVLPFLITNAQVSYGETPYSIQKNLLVTIPSVDFDALDVEALKREDELYYTEKGRSLRYGYEHEVSVTATTHGIWTTLANGDRIWNLEINCKEAISIGMIFNQFFIPTKGKLHIYNKDRSDIRGAFTEASNKEHGKFSVAPIFDETIILEYYEPQSVAGKGILDIKTIIHAYSDIRGYGDSGSCNINVNCPLGDDWDNEKRSVLKILDGGFDHCSGALINNAINDCTPYFLTADHCDGQVNTWVFLFNWESPTCINENMPVNQTISGSTNRASYGPSDFLLVELDETIPSDYNAYLAGWDSENSAPQNCIGIHHPSGDIKKISWNENTLTNSTFTGTPNSHWRVTQWEEGTTEGGSSGSPIFDENHRIVGDLSGGQASCFNLSAWDVYGKISYSWDTGNNASSRLKDWLDPNNSGLEVLDGRNCGSEPEFNVDGGMLNIISPNGSNCDALIYPSFIFENQGEQTIQNAVFSYTVGDEVNNFDVWEGSIATFETETITLLPFGVLEGTYEIEICLLSVNGVTDQNDSNNCITSSFFCSEIELDAAFDISDGTICAGDFVTLTDQSSGNPSVYSWTVEGAIPSIATGNQVTILFPNAGTYDVTLSIGNGNSSDTGTIQNAITVYETPFVDVDIEFPNEFGTATVTALIDNGLPPYHIEWDELPFNDETTQLNEGLHEVTITDQNDCSTTLQFAIGSVNIHELNELGIQIANPSFDGSIQWSMNQQLVNGQAKCKIIGLDGKSLYSDIIDLNAGQLQHGIEQPGIYFVSFTMGNITYFDKVLIH